MKGYEDAAAVAVAVAVKERIMDKKRFQYIIKPLLMSMIDEEMPANAIIRTMKRLGMSYRRGHMLRDIRKLRKRYAS